MVSLVNAALGARSRKCDMRVCLHVTCLSVCLSASLLARVCNATHIRSAIICIIAILVVLTAVSRVRILSAPSLPDCKEHGVLGSRWQAPQEAPQGNR